MQARAQSRLMRVIMILIHATHEAGVKLGGIGAVLDGLLSAPSYVQNVEHTIAVGTMNTSDSTEMERLFAPRNKLYVHYYATGGFNNCAPELSWRLSELERDYSVRILYGKRAFGKSEHDILLVDASNINAERFRAFNYFVWRRFGLDSWQYQNEPEFRTVMAHAEPAFLALQAAIANWLLVDSTTQPAHPTSNNQQPTIVCHEFMGLPLWYAAELSAPGQFKSAFVAHETASVRPIVEWDRGHDTRFYNVMFGAMNAGLYLEDVFGDQGGNFKHAMIKTAAACDHVLAVGDLVVDELRFVSEAYRKRRIDLVYNGAPSRKISADETQAASAKLKHYARELLGIEPSFVFSHVTRLVPSKGLWRDIRVMEQLDSLLAVRGASAVLFMVSTVIPQGRSSAEAQRMARDYGWPRDHRYGWPDLITLEAELYPAIAAFNARAHASRIVLVNQFGFSRDRIGPPMPEDLQFEDLRIGTDLEFGQSIYEPFGIAQVEPLSSGALCVISNVCGCLGFVTMAAKDAFGEGTDVVAKRTPVVVADYVSPAARDWRSAMRIGQRERDEIEQRASHDVAQQILSCLPRTLAQKQALIDSGYALAQRMSWDVVAKEQLLPALNS